MLQSAGERLIGAVLENLPALEFRLASKPAGADRRRSAQIVCPAFHPLALVFGEATEHRFSRHVAGEDA